MIDFESRPYRPSDEALVVKTWLESFAHSQYGRRWRTRDSGMRAALDRSWAEHHKTVTYAMRRGRVDVICDAEHPDMVYAWACTEPPNVVHYAVVKMSVAADGFGKGMLDRLFGDMLKERCLMSHEPAWVSHTRETRLKYIQEHPSESWSKIALEQHHAKRPLMRPPDVLVTEHNAVLPYYYQPHEAFYPLPQAWKLDEYYLSRKACEAA